MKRGWIAVGLIAASLLLGGTEWLYHHTAAHIYVEMLNEADEAIAQNEAYKAQSVTQRLCHRFDEDKTLFRVLCFHSEINTIDAELAALTQYARTGSTADFLAQSAQTKRRITALAQQCAPRLENIL